MSTVNYGEVEVEPSESDLQNMERFGKPNLSPSGKEICGEPLSGKNKGECTLRPGAGTTHEGFGPCYHHGGDNNKQALEIARSTDGVDVRVIKHTRLRQLFEQERNKENIDNIDGEIALISSMIQLTGETFGMKMKEDGTYVEVSSNSLLAAQAHSLSVLIDRKTVLIKRKWELLQIAGDVFEKGRVRAYVSSIQTVINDILRDECRNCGAKHNMRERVFAAFKLIGSL